MQNSIQTLIDTAKRLGWTSPAHLSSNLDAQYEHASDFLMNEKFAYQIHGKIEGSANKHRQNDIHLSYFLPVNGDCETQGEIHHNGKQYEHICMDGDGKFYQIIAK